MTEQTAAAPPRPPSRVQEIIWGLVATALLAGYIGWNMGWTVALAAVVGVFVHEYGHVLAMNAMGFGPGKIRIVPFVGGVAIPARPADTEFKGVLIALAGPVFGLLALAPFFIAFALTGQERWLSGAFFIAAISLLNLAPAPPLDGSKALGPALARIHPWVERGALILVGGTVVLWAVTRGSLIFGLFVGLGVLGALRRGRLRPAARRLNGPEWAGAVALYLAALAVCAVAVGFTLDPAVLGAVRRLLRL